MFIAWVQSITTLAVALALGVSWDEAHAQKAGQDEAKSKQTATDRVTVSAASRTEQEAHLAPAPVTVLSDAYIDMAPANEIGELLRKVEGLNVIQISARDYQVAGRSAGGSLSTGQLVLVDGRTIYLDFFGFVMWDLMPIDSGEIKQIEVVRGPGSAVWGANALTGVVNVITKTPSELVGPAAATSEQRYAQRTTIVGGGGEFDTRYGSLTHAGVRDRWSYKVSGGYFRQDAFGRPQGNVPGTGTPYPPFANSGTEQPKFEARVDYELDRWSNVSVSGGYAGTGGILHSGIGPFDIDTGTYLTHGRAGYTRNQLDVVFYANVLDGDATNLLTSDAMGQPIQMVFKTQKYNLDVTNTTPVGRHNILTYGVNGRINNFDLTIAPRGEDRNELGIFVQDEILLHDIVRVIGGVRWDHFDLIGSVWSPRASLLLSPHREHTFRFSFGQSFRAPSVVQNFLEIDIVVEEVAGSLISAAALGNQDLKEEKLTSFEGGWVGRFHERADVAFSVYRNKLENNIDFYPSEYYSPENPPDNWPLPPQTVPRNTLPSMFTYRNIGEIVNWGFEIGVTGRPADLWTAFANYTWQEDPETKGIPREEINTPPRHRVNLGVAYDRPRFFVSTDLSFVDNAFWTDVLDARYWGPTDSYRQWNAKAGVRLGQGRVTISVLGTNLLDEDIQQHVFGDIISRKLGAEVRVAY